MQHVKLNEIPAMAISPEERAFFIELGARIAELRKAQGITQIQAAEVLEVSQQTINSYEVGRRRIPVSALPSLAKMLAISIDELLGEETTATKKRGPASTLQRQIDQIGLMPRTKQKFVSEMLDALIQQQQQAS